MFNSLSDRHGRPMALSRHASAGCVAAALALVASGHYLQLPSGWLRRGVVHVAPDGFDGFVGPSRRSAVRPIPRAAPVTTAPGFEAPSVPGGTGCRSLVMRITSAQE